MRFLLAGLLALALTACATVESGRSYDTAAAAAFKEGVTTKAEVIAALGKPTNVTHTSEGITVLVYSHIVAKGNGLTGSSNATGNTASYVFGADDVLKQVGLQTIDSTTR